MRLFIDADGCPVTDISVRIAHEHEIECVIVCDNSHWIEKENATTITVEKGADSADFKIVNMIQTGDVIVTQDYGLAAMCLARRAIPISQNGLVFTEYNIDSLLNQRHTAKKIRMAGGRLKGPSKRVDDQNRAFENSLLEVIQLNKCSLRTKDSRS